MNKKLSCTFLIALIFCLLTEFTFAQSSRNLNEFVNSIDKFSKAFDDSISADTLKNALVHSLTDLTADADLMNKAWDVYIDESSGLSFLKGLNLKFKTFQSSTTDSISGLGFHYAVSKDIMKHIYSQQAVKSTGLCFSINAEGDVAFNQKINPADFLNSQMSFHFFQSRGGTLPIQASPAMATYLNKLEDQLASIDNEEELRNSPLWEKLFSNISNFMTTQFYIDFSLKAALESNQDFSRKNYVYGAQLGFDLKAWNRNSTLANLNIFDWPFAVIRVLTGYDKKLSPRGSTIPTVLVGLDRINPTGDPYRVDLLNDLYYTRYRTEIGFRTPIASSAFFSANWRYLYELSPKQSIINADNDKFEYFVAAVTLSNGMFLSYSNGKLPFDEKNSQIYQMGFHYKL